jgi:hypothetical protein
MSSLPLNGEPGDVLPRLIGILMHVVESPSVDAFRIGRIDDPDKIRASRDGDQLMSLYAADDVSEAFLVGDTLRRLFRFHAKHMGDIDADPDIPSDRNARTVYVELWSCESNELAVVS